MSVYLGYDTLTKQYLKSLTGGGGASSSSGVDTSGFTMSGDIDMDGNEIVGLDDPSDDSSATSKKYEDDEIAKVGGGLDQATADNRYLKKADAVTTYETQSNVNNNYRKKTDATNKYLTQNDATNTYLSKTDATSTYALTDASYTKSESDTKYARKGSSSGFNMTGDIDMGDNKILKLADPITSKSATNKEYVDNNFLSKHGGLILEIGNIAMSGQSITNLNPTPQNNNDAVTKSYVDNAIKLSGGLSVTGLKMQGDIDMNGNEISGLVDP